MPTATNDVAHLLRRAGFGGTVAEINALTSLDRTALVDRVLDTSGAPSVPMPAFLTGSMEEWQKISELGRWWIGQMATTPTPIVEKLALFWHGHFATGGDKVFISRALYNQNQLFRTQGLGNFRDLVKAVARDPAMLIYLDNDPNEAGSPNENFARELMELFTVGLDQYTQSDVSEGARAWTGHGITESETNPAYEFHPAKHDNANKTIFGITKNWDGPQIVDELCYGSRQAVMARFIARKVFSFFAYPSPPSAVVQQLADAFIASNLSIKALVRAVFLHDEFWSATARNGLVRTPVEFVVAAMRHTGTAIADVHPEWWLGDMGQMPFYPPNVAGWKQNQYWIHPTAFWAKSDFARNLGWQLGNTPFFGNLKNNSVAAPAAVQQALDQFGITQPSAGTRQLLEAWLTTERSKDSWFIPPGLVTLLLIAPEFQLA